MASEGIDYTKLFDPEPGLTRRSLTDYSPDPIDDPSVFIWGEDMVFAVNVALATGRPLLIRGEPGVGKTSVARAAAEILNWRFYRCVVGSRTEAADLLWRTDAVRRIADANTGAGAEGLNEYNYIDPGILWWAINPETALRRGRRDTGPVEEARDPFAEINLTADRPRRPDGAVVLIDEIDKADPDFPNDLLQVTGSLRFDISIAGRQDTVSWGFERPQRIDVKANDISGVLLVVTTNEERDLPEAFLRRCVVHQMLWPGNDPDEPAGEAILRSARPVSSVDLTKIVTAHWRRIKDITGALSEDDQKLIDHLIKMHAAARREAADRRERRPGLAELIDTLAVVASLGTNVDQALFEQIVKSMVWNKGSENRDL